MNGWLFPSGKFLECESGKHGEVALTLKPSKKGRYVHVFSHGVFSDGVPTRKQRDWLLKSLEQNSDETYRDMVQMLLEK